MVDFRGPEIGHHRFEGMDGERLAEWVRALKTGPGAEEASRAATAVNQAADVLADLDDQLRSELGKLGVTWSGNAGEMAQEQVRQQTATMTAGDPVVRAAGTALNAQGEEYSTTKHKLPDPDSLQHKQSENLLEWIGGAFGYESDYDHEAKQIDDVKRGAVEALTAYQRGTVERTEAFEPLPPMSVPEEVAPVPSGDSGGSAVPVSGPGDAVHPAAGESMAGEPMAGESMDGHSVDGQPTGGLSTGSVPTSGSASSASGSIYPDTLDTVPQTPGSTQSAGVSAGYPGAVGTSPQPSADPHLAPRPAAGYPGTIPPGQPGAFPGVGDPPGQPSTGGQPVPGRGGVPTGPQPGSQQPGSQLPGGHHQPGTQPPGSHQPGSHQPGSHQPGSQPGGQPSSEGGRGSTPGSGARGSVGTPVQPGGAGTPTGGGSLGGGGQEIGRGAPGLGGLTGKEAPRGEERLADGKVGGSGGQEQDVPDGLVDDAKSREPTGVDLGNAVSIGAAGAAVLGIGAVATGGLLKGGGADGSTRTPESGEGRTSGIGGGPGDTTAGRTATDSSTSKPGPDAFMQPAATRGAQRRAEDAEHRNPHGTDETVFDDNRLAAPATFDKTPKRVSDDEPANEEPANQDSPNQESASQESASQESASEPETPQLATQQPTEQPQPEAGPAREDKPQS